ncbi:hypothetical protein GGR57DRAFT_465088 [Xylariaceae sp. FL1272]|nr:hypothetical protein GGR57DRAFT_465088 [Xylariaceae sp. FL1272]
MSRTRPRSLSAPALGSIVSGRCHVFILEQNPLFLSATPAAGPQHQPSQTQTTSSQSLPAAQKPWLDILRTWRPDRKWEIISGVATLIGIVITGVTLWPTFAGWKTGTALADWTANKDFIEYCEDVDLSALPQVT